SGPRTAEAYSAELGLDARAAALALDALVALDIASREGDTYDMSARIKDFFRPLGQQALPMQNLWRHLTTLLRTGEPFMRMADAPAECEQSYRHAVSGLAQLLDAPSRELATKLGFTPARVLDVGCGSGVWSLAIAERLPDTHVTGLDLPAV